MFTIYLERMDSIPRTNNYIYYKTLKIDSIGYPQKKGLCTA